jgi:hypothetical protein
VPPPCSNFTLNYYEN